MAKCELSIQFDKADRKYAAGEKVTGTVEVRAHAGITCNALTLTREWRTHGKGDTCKGETATVTLFQGRWPPGETVTYGFSVDVPNGPVTYHGHVLSVDWYLKARANIPWSLDAKAEEDFIVVPGYEMPDQGPFGLPDSRGGWSFAFLYEAAFGLDVTIEPHTVLAGGTMELCVSFKPMVVVELENVTAKIVGRERAMGGSGSYNEEYTHVLYTKTVEEASHMRLAPRERVEWRQTLRVPDGAVPTFAAWHNNLEWLIIVKVVGASREPLRLPRKVWQREYPITVLPAPAAPPKQTKGSENPRGEHLGN